MALEFFYIPNLYFFSSNSLINPFQSVFDPKLLLQGSGDLQLIKSKDYFHSFLFKITMAFDSADDYSHFDLSLHFFFLFPSTEKILLLIIFLKLGIKTREEKESALRRTDRQKRERLWESHGTVLRGKWPMS